MSIRQRNAHFTDWAAVCRALNVNTESEARTALESSDNTFYYHVCYIKSTKEIYTHGQFYNSSGSSEEILNLINALTEEVAENEEVTAKALSDLNENKASRGEVEIFATSKQDTITDLDAIRSGAAAGATALQTVPDEYITENELTGMGFATVSQVDTKQDKIDDLDSIRTKANNAVQQDQISNFVSTKDLSTVATTGDYNDLLNVPDILTTEDVSPVCYTGNYDDLNNKPTIPAAQVNSDWNATSGKAQILNKPIIPKEVLESTVSNWGFTKNTGTYSKPSGGIPKSDLASAVQTSLGKADTALQSYTEQYRGTITGITMNGESKGTSGVIDLGTIITEHQNISGKQDLLVSGSNIKTINGNSILGSGDLTITSGENNVQSDWNVTDTSSDAYIKNKPTIPNEVVESTVSDWGFTKNEGTVTAITVDNKSKYPSNIGVIDLGYIHKQRITFTESTITLQPNVYYKSTNTSMSSFTFRLGSITNTNIMNEYFIEFTTSSSGTTVTLPAMVKWVGGVAPTFEAGYTYQISIVDNLGTYIKFA